MIKVIVSFHGYLHKYNNGKDRLELNVPDNSTIGDVVSRTDVPSDELAFAALNGTKVPFSHQVTEQDEIRIFQLVAGG